MSLQYIERKTGQKEIEKIYGFRSLKLLYGESWISWMISVWLLPLLCRCSWVSQFYGFLQKRSQSAKKIRPFIEYYKIDVSEFADTKFRSFNDFFIRKLKVSSRPIVKDENIAVLPADGRHLVFPNVSQTDSFYVKGQMFDLVSFLGDASLADYFQNSSMLISRLCPTDYHRFHFPCKGIPGHSRLIEGPLFSVSPLALKKNILFLFQNKRMVTVIDTFFFKKIVYVEIGATCVGTIHQTFLPMHSVEKGEEKGYFSFGGSCIVILFEKGTIQFDPDLIQNSLKGLETRANFGESLGVSRK